MSLQVILKVIASLVLLLPAVARAEWPPEREGFELLGFTHDESLQELSGIAVSRRDGQTFWSLNDGGNAAQLVPVSHERKPHSIEQAVRPAVNVAQVLNNDWEDLAAYVDGGQPMLVIADTGDNLGLRFGLRLVFVPEPEPGQTTVQPTRLLRFSWEGGPRDRESLAVDPIGRRILLAYKGQHPSGLFELMLDGPDEQVARRIADFPPLSPKTFQRVPTIGGRRWHGSPTAMDLSSDGLRLLVLTNDSLNLFERRPEESWASALLRPAVNVLIPDHLQFESAAFSVDGRNAWIAAEGRWSHFYRWAAMPAAAP
jgi:hypothetical protein